MKKEEFKPYICQASLIPGHNYKEVAKIARRVFNEIQSRSKRRPYVRSAYFKGEKIFLDNFWPHLAQKKASQRMSRLIFLPCAIELIRKSRIKPLAQKGEISSKATLYRFLGRVGDQFFVVQIKEDLNRDQKFFMSVFRFTKK